MRFARLLPEQSKSGWDFGAAQAGQFWERGLGLARGSWDPPLWSSG